MSYDWELKMIKDWDTNKIRNYIWMAVCCGQPVPGCISVDALRNALVIRGEEPIGHHNT